MKKVLFITYYFPPLPDIGAQRPYRLVKYLPKYGWEPIVLTAKLPGKPPEGINIIETDYKDVTRIIMSKFGFNPEKGLHDLVDAFNEITDCTCKLVIVGNADHPSRYSMGLEEKCRKDTLNSCPVIDELMA